MLNHGGGEETCDGESTLLNWTSDLDWNVSAKIRINPYALNLFMIPIYGLDCGSAPDFRSRIKVGAA